MLFPTMFLIKSTQQYESSELETFIWGWNAEGLYSVYWQYLETCVQNIAIYTNILLVAAFECDSMPAVQISVFSIEVFFI